MRTRIVATALASAFIAAAATVVAAPASASVYGGTYPTYIDCRNAGIYDMDGKYTSFTCVPNGGAPGDAGGGYSLYLS